MRFPRSSGILLHPTSLPGEWGIGDLGPAAYRFAEFLAGAGQKIWQVLPLHPTGYGDSPYQCFSAFAGNPLLISLDRLVEQGLLQPANLPPRPLLPDTTVDFGCVIPFKLAALRAAERNFRAWASAQQVSEFENFCGANAAWLDDFALFMAAKNAHGAGVWTEWEPGLAARRPEALRSWSERLAGEIAAFKLWQFWFDEQWQSLKRFCAGRGIRTFGDVPIYVAHDSTDVWANAGLFRLDAHGDPVVVAGVPPDYFSATGQLWGNPIYRWDVLRDQGYAWWVERLRNALRLFDMVRLDHFRGFQAYWELPGGDETAVRGRWVEGPGAELFAVLQRELGRLPIIAENLGVITPEVEAIRQRFGFPGMAILQFAFGNDPQAASFRPHNYQREIVAYTGTHDNDTAVGWWTNRGGGSDSIRRPEEIEREHAYARAYLGCGREEINWALIRAVVASVADTAIIPLQDVLGAGGDARMNLPGRPSGNWRWRFTEDALKPELQERLKTLTTVYDR